MKQEPPLHPSASTTEQKTLWDEYALAAAHAIVEDEVCGGSMKGSMSLAAKRCANFADAVMKERSRRAEEALLPSQPNTCDECGEVAVGYGADGAAQCERHRKNGDLAREVSTRG